MIYDTDIQIYNSAYIHNKGGLNVNQYTCILKKIIIIENTPYICICSESFKKQQ